MNGNDGASRYTPGAHRPAMVAVAAVLAGVLLLAMGTTFAVRSRPAPDVGTGAVQRLTTSGAPMPVPSATAPPAVVPPARLGIPAIGVDARVVAVGVDPRTGEFAVPATVNVVGWYRFGPGLEAVAGSAVIAGHVDSAEQGRGALLRLRELAPKARIDVTGADGRTRTYHVIARAEYDKARVPLEQAFARDGAPRLTLITCGGPFDDRTRRYRDNVLVTALRVS